MTAGAVRVPQSMINRPRSTFEVDSRGARMMEQIVDATAKQQAIVFTRISIRPGDNTDVLEALGLIPTIYRDVPRREPSTCAVCGWSSSPGKDPRIALLSHNRVHSRQAVSA